jgi:translation initiation factor 1|tara:strand:- start:337 stop:672 length:336 start_codon:yes stop_codon:yes gene_type:complete
MKKLNSLEELGTLMPDGFKTKKPFEIDNSFSKQNLEAHYSVKGRAGVPVIILKGFSGLNKEDLKNLAKPIKNKLGIGGSVKKNEIYFQGDKREKIISILESQGHSVKRIGG